MRDKNIWKKYEEKDYNLKNFEKVEKKSNL